MFRKVLLTAAEKVLIKKIMRKQIQSHRDILDNNCGEDVVLQVLQEGVCMADFTEQMDENIQKYEEVLDNPRELFNMDEEDLSIAKHIMFNFANHPKYDLGKQKLWSKFLLIEKICLQ